MNKDEILKHLCKSTSNCQILTDHFDRFQITSPFSNDTYQTIINNIPHEDHFTFYEYPKGIPENSRMVLSLDHKFRPQNIHNIWNELTLALESEEVKTAFLNIAGIDRSKVGNSTSVKLVKDRDGFYIPSHPDVFPKLMTIIFNLPEDGSQQDFGTDFYADKNGTQEIEKFPFLPNTCTGFTVTKNSFHGKKFIQNAKKPRHVIFYTIFAIDVDVNHEGNAIKKSFKKP